ncbi:MAG TPA: Smr/MutS family protein [Myxococcales bacterium]|jgi:DNA-nicking Smr family endonuclease
MAQKDQGKGKAKQDAFNNSPFKGLKTALKEAKAAAAPAPRAPAARPTVAQQATASDEELFARAMFGVERVVDPHGRAPPPAPRSPSVVDEDAETLARLAELVSGEGSFDIADTDEFIEGAAPGMDKRVLAALRRGEYAVQGHVDLHGLTKAEAKEEVDRFLTAARRDGKRCVLVVHGRGLNSKDHIPVLKEQVKVWLQRGRIGKAVLAFATARPHDGGAGAVYVLLRR